MSTFHLIDLISQARAVQSLLHGKSAEEKIEWLSAHGSITLKPKQQQDERQCFWFEGQPVGWAMPTDHFRFSNINISGGSSRLPTAYFAND